MKMQRVRKRIASKEFGIYLIVPFLGLGLIGLGVAPYRNFLEKMDSDISESRNRLVLYQRALNWGGQVSRDDQVRIASESSSAADANGLLKTIDETAKHTGLRLEGFRPQASNPKTNSAAPEIELQARGSVQELANFLYSLLEIRPCLKVVRMSIRQGQEGVQVHCTVRQSLEQVR